MRWWLFMPICAWGVAGWMGSMAVSAAASRHWPAVPCTIESSFVQDVGGPTPYVFRVSYRYEWFGKPYEGRIYREDSGRSHNIAEASRLTRAFPVGSQRVCYVDPRDPTVAVLAHQALWPAALVAAMMFVGGCAILGMLFPVPLRTKRILAALQAPFLIAVGLGGYLVFFGFPLRDGLRSLGCARPRARSKPGKFARLPIPCS